MNAMVVAVLTLLPLPLQMEATGSIQDVTLTLSSDRSTYYPGEAAHLELHARNEGRGSVRGYFKLSAGQKRAEYWYGRKGASPRRFAPRWKHYHPAVPDPWLGVPLPSTLARGEERVSQSRLVFDPETRLFVLDQPGEYEFFVVNHPDPKDASIEARSNTLIVRVDEPPPALREAYDAYHALGLGDLLQSPGSYTGDATRIRAARDFLDQHPNGPYAEGVQQAYVAVLKGRVAQAIATKEEQAQLQRLTDRERPH